VAGRPLSRHAESALFLVASVSLGGYLLARGESVVYEAVQERRLEHASAEVAPASGPSASLPRARPPARRADAPLPAEEVIGRIEAPRLGLTAIVAEGLAARTLRRAVGHVPGTALPGEDGNVGLAGHRDTAFRKLRDVREGDRLRLTTPRGAYEYVVESTLVVEPHRGDLLDPTDAPALTLVTCHPFRMVGPAPQRFVVRALLVKGP
jgi:sortase A